MLNLNLTNIESIDLSGTAKQIERFAKQGIVSIDTKLIDLTQTYQIITDGIYHNMKSAPIKSSDNQEIYCWFNKGKINFGLADKYGVRGYFNFYVDKDHDLFLLPKISFEHKKINERNDIINKGIKNLYDKEKEWKDFEFNFKSEDNNSRQTILIVSNYPIKLHRLNYPAAPKQKK